MNKRKANKNDSNLHMKLYFSFFTPIKNINLHEHIHMLVFENQKKEITQYNINNHRMSRNIMNIYT